MSSIGTFGAFTQARFGIYAAQAGLSVTGNNISNINTEGYTRQKLNQTSFYAGGSDRFYSTYDIRIGNGALCTGVSQLRDPYLDIRYRSEMSSVGAMDAKLSGLEDIQRVLDEVGDGDDDFGIISAQLSDFLNQLEQLSDQTGLDENDIQVRSSAEALCKQLNSYAAQLEEIRRNAETSFKQDLTTVNNILTSIRDLNNSIRKAEIHGDNALELRDTRNTLIDQLSSYMKIDVIYTEEDIGGGTMVEKLTIKLGDANPDKTSTTDSSTLVDGIYATQLSITQVADPNNPGEMMDDPNLRITLDALKDSKDRVLYTIEKTGQEETTTFPGQTSVTTTDPATGIITIKTYEKTSRTKASQDANGNFLDENGIVVDEDHAEQLPVYIMKTYTKTPSTAVDLADNDLYGSLQSQRELLTESGEFASADTIADVDPNAASKRGIPFYQKALDLLANQFATVFNEANQGFLYNEKGNYIDSNGEEITLDGSPISKDGLTEAQQTALAGQTLDDYLQNNDGEKIGAVLFSNRGDGDDTTGITASNISISLTWSNGPSVVGSFMKPTGLDNVASTDSSNILHMIALLSTKMEYIPHNVDADAGDTSMFYGDFSEMWVNIGSILGNDMMSTSTMLDTYYASSVELDSSREAASGVDLNDEAMNLMQYSKSYNAACRLMTTLDSVLDKLINGTGVTT